MFLQISSQRHWTQMISICVCKCYNLLNNTNNASNAQASKTCSKCVHCHLLIYNIFLVSIIISNVNNNTIGLLSCSVPLQRLCLQDCHRTDTISTLEWLMCISTHQPPSSKSAINVCKNPEAAVYARQGRRLQ